MALQYPRLPLLILPYTRNELPGWGKLFGIFGIGSDSDPKIWKQAPVTWIRGKWHHYRMKLDLSDWCDRHTYFLGRYYELATQLVLQSILKPGDRFVDVGANHGMISMLGAYLVGKDGRVDSIEPNPGCIERIQEHIQQNNIAHIHIHECALGSVQTFLQLTQLTEHTGYGTLTHIPEKDQHLITRIIDVPVKKGDDILADHDQQPALIKMDVEGFELNALHGLSETLHNSHCPVMTEVLDNYLKRAGHTREQLIDFMTTHGYTGYQIATRRRGLRHRLHLTLLPENPGIPMSSTDVLWLHNNHWLSDGLRKRFI